MDQYIKGTGANHQVRVIAAITTDLVQEGHIRHQTSPVVSAAFGRLLTAGVLMGVTMKNDQDLMTIQVKGDGPVKGLLVTANAKGQVKGYPSVSNVDMPLKVSGKLDVSGAIGKGILQISKDIGLKEPYTGQVELVSGELAEDLTYYYYYSEQVPTVMALGVLVDRDYSIRQAGGILIQLMPGASESVIAQLEACVGAAKSVTELLEQGASMEVILKSYLGDLPYEIMVTDIPRYQCDCHLEKVQKALISLGKEEILDMIDTKEVMHLSCHFCGKQYDFSTEDLRHLLNDNIK